MKIWARSDKQEQLPKVRLMTIWFGANDACLPGSKQHVSLDKYSENLSQLIHMVTDSKSDFHSPGTKIILITPPPINVQQWGARLAADDPPKALDRAFDITAKYAQAVRDVAAKEGVLIVDAFQALWSAAGQEESALTKFLSDGLHLTADGYTVNNTP